MVNISQSSDSPRILIIRLSAFGDIVIASLLLPALRVASPNAYIAWMVEDRFAAMIEDNPYLDDLYILPRQHWKTLWQQRHYIRVVKECGQFIKRLRQARFDWVLDIQGLLKSGIWAWLSGAKHRIGLGSKEGSQYLMTACVSRQTGNKLLGTEYIQLAQYLELACVDYPTGIVLAEQAQVNTQQLLNQCALKGDFIALCPFTTRPQKHWFNERWTHLAEVLTAQFALPIVILGSSADSVQAEHIIKAGTVKVHNLCGKTGLQDAGGILSQARLVIGVDTGLTHLGIVLERPTIALFGSTRPYFDTRSPCAQVIYNPHECSPCRRNPICDARYDCMDSITIPQVLDVAKKFLQVGK